MQTSALARSQPSRHLQHQPTAINLFSVSRHIYRKGEEKVQTPIIHFAFVKCLTLKLGIVSQPALPHTHTLMHQQQKVSLSLFNHPSLFKSSHLSICWGIVLFCSPIIFHWTLLAFLICRFMLMEMKSLGFCNRGERQVEVKHNSFHLAGK